MRTTCAGAHTHTRTHTRTFVHTHTHTHTHSCTRTLQLFIGILGPPTFLLRRLIAAVCAALHSEGKTQQSLTISPSLPSANTRRDVQRHARLHTQTHFNYLPKNPTQPTTYTHTLQGKQKALLLDQIPRVCHVRRKHNSLVSR